MQTGKSCVAHDHGSRAPQSRKGEGPCPGGRDPLTTAVSSARHAMRHAANEPLDIVQRGH